MSRRKPESEKMQVGRKKYKDEYQEVKVKIPVKILKFLKKPYATSIRNMLISLYPMEEITKKTQKNS